MRRLVGRYKWHPARKRKTDIVTAIQCVVLFCSGNKASNICLIVFLPTNVERLLYFWSFFLLEHYHIFMRRVFAVFTILKFCFFFLFFFLQLFRVSSYSTSGKDDDNDTAGANHRRLPGNRFASPHTTHCCLLVRFGACIGTKTSSGGFRKRRGLQRQTPKRGCFIEG